MGQVLCSVDGLVGGEARRRWGQSGLLVASSNRDFVVVNFHNSCWALKHRDCWAWNSNLTFPFARPFFLLAVSQHLPSQSDPARGKIAHAARNTTQHTHKHTENKKIFIRFIRKPSRTKKKPEYKRQLLELCGTFPVRAKSARTNGQTRKQTINHIYNYHNFFSYRVF